MLCHTFDLAIELVPFPRLPSHCLSLHMFTRSHSKASTVSNTLTRCVEIVNFFVLTIGPVLVALFFSNPSKHAFGTELHVALQTLP